MKQLRGILVLLALLVSVNIVAKPKIRIIATGGTIAGVSQSATSSAYSFFCLQRRTGWRSDIDRRRSSDALSGRHQRRAARQHRFSGHE